jgi:hypothetical protein
VIAVLERDTSEYPQDKAVKAGQYGDRQQKRRRRRKPESEKRRLCAAEVAGQIGTALRFGERTPWLADGAWCRADMLRFI